MKYVQLRLVGAGGKFEIFSFKKKVISFLKGKIDMFVSTNCPGVQGGGEKDQVDGFQNGTNSFHPGMNSFQNRKKNIGTIHNILGTARPGLRLD